MNALDSLRAVFASRQSVHVREVSARPLDVAMKKAFGISGGAQHHAHNVLVTIVLEDGTRGYGEGAPFPAFNGETQAAALASAREIGPQLLTSRPHDGPDVLGPFRERIAGATPSARCALETALVDAYARSADVSIRAALGGVEERLTTDITITTGTVAQAEAEARAFAGFRTLKVKIGGDHEAIVDQDIARVRAIRKARPDAILLIDANGGYTREQALAFAHALKSTSIALFEQPVPRGDWDSLAMIRRDTKLKIAIDESCTSADDVRLAKTLGAADFTNVKIMKSGVFEALEIIDATVAADLGKMIGGMVETRLAMGMSAQIAAGLGGFSFIDLDTPLFLAEDPFDGGYAQADEVIDLRALRAGLGVTPRA